MRRNLPWAFFSILAALLLVPTTIGTHATCMFSDSFDNENGGVGQEHHVAFANWNVQSPGETDLYGNGFNDFLPGNGLYLDMEGTTSPGAYDTWLLSKKYFSFQEGHTYTLQFDLAGSQRHQSIRFPNLVTVSLSSGATEILNETFLKLPTDPFETITREFSVPWNYNTFLFRIRFFEQGQDLIGLLLDDVSLNACGIEL